MNLTKYLNTISPLLDLFVKLNHPILVTNEGILRKFRLSSSLGSILSWESVPQYYLKFRVKGCPQCLVLQWRQIVLIKRSTVSALGKDCIISRNILV